MSEQEPVHVFQKFLGIDSLGDDPVALLALTPQAISEGGIIGALQKRLAQVAAHPDAMTPEADEVRLALHAAAARLLDPTARRQAKARQLNPVDIEPSQPGHAPVDNARPTDPPPEPTPLEAAVILTMATMGGWNRRSMQRIGALAQAYGVPGDEVVKLAESLIGRPVIAKPTPVVPPRLAVRARPGAPRVQSADPSLTATQTFQAAGAFPESGAPPPVHIDHSSGVVKLFMVLGGILLLGAAAVVVIVLSMLTAPASQTPPPTLPEPAPVAATTQTPSKELFPTRPKEAPAETPKPVVAPPTSASTWNDLLRAATQCVTLLDTDQAQAVKEFELVYREMSRRWGDASGDGLVAGVDRIVEFMYRASAKKDTGTVVAGMIVAGLSPLTTDAAANADQVFGAAWSAGLLARLAREKDLPADVRHSVQDAITHAFPGASGPGEYSFKSGCLAALSVLPGKILFDPEAKDEGVLMAEGAWRAWFAGLAAVGDKDSPLYTRSALLALDALLVSGAEPTQSRITFESVSLMVVAIPWRKDDESRRWLLRWFDTPAISSNDLYAVTGALANQSGAEGVDSSMVLSVAAGEGGRAEMRDRYASVWGMTAGQPRDVLVKGWGDAARNELGLDLARMPSLQVLEEALQVARFNRAAMLLWTGDTDDVQDLLIPIQRSVVTANAANSRSRNDVLNQGVPRSSEWLVKYLAAGHNAITKRELLSELRRTPDAAEADQLVEEACRSSSPQLHTLARELIIKYGDTPAVVNALLEFSPVMPVSRENTELVEQVSLASLPPIRDPGWRVAVRRVLLERLTQLIAGQSELAKVDHLGDRIAEAYAASSSGAEADSAPPPIPETSAAALRIKWQREAELLVASTREPFSLAQIESRRVARSHLVSGRVHEFAVEQVSICELMAYVCVAEQPGRAAAAAAILEDLTVARRKARHIFDQLLAAERARMKLWMLRLEEKPA